MMGRMNYKALAPLALAAIIAFAQPVAFIAQEAGKAAEILALARKAIGGKKLEALKTFSVESSLQRNIADRQINSEVEIVLDLPDKYLRHEIAGGGMMLSGGGVTGFSGERSLQQAGTGAPGGAMVIRMGGPGGAATNPGEKPTPEQIEQVNRAMVRTGQVEASRLMLGWFASAHPTAKVEYTYAGDAESPDGKAYVIDVKNADNFTARLFIDQQTHLPLMVTYKAPQPRMMMAGGPAPAAAPAGGHGGGHVVTQMAGGTPEERKKAQADAEKQIQEMQRQPAVLADFQIFFDDWRDADGVKFPFKMRRAMAGTTTEEWTVNKVKVNPKVDAKRFVPQS
jgi:hypothetical protein